MRLPERSVLGLAFLLACPGAPTTPVARPCPDGTTDVLGACVPFDVADAYCGRASKVLPGGGCDRARCGPGEALELGSGVCLPPSIGRALLSREADDDRIATCSAGVLERPAPAADLLCAAGPLACSRGERSENEKDACVPLPPCGAGEMFDEAAKKCRRVVGSVVDVGSWARLAIGTDGGEGSNAFCAPVRSVGGGRFRVRLTLPDNDVTQVSARVDPLPPTTPTASDAAERSAEQLSNVLRFMPGTASAASVSLDVVCTPPRRVLPTLEAPKATGGRGR